MMMILCFPRSLRIRAWCLGCFSDITVSVRPLTTTSCLIAIKSINVADLCHSHFTHSKGTERNREKESNRQRTRDHSMKIMKSAVVVIVFLNMLHRCLSNNLRTEILNDLSNLTPENFTYPKQYRVPASQMREKACECQGMFATGLKHVVNKVKARTEEHKPLLNRLQKNIQALPQKSTPKEASICPMKSKSLLTRPPNTIVLMAYRYFLKNLNEKEC
ncbi:uncharacterized protein LOC115118690 [Oncorhynchus nerka]|uniref:uncharacterized protein LOC115118690 n=1 Tax=Oncorhynchus nerka TaxID=8023 RepID=UPI0011324F84|nr:uncharacterized protein LOC115118690 [Oncorhynchus nerka]